MLPVIADGKDQSCDGREFCMLARTMMDIVRVERYCLPTQTVRIARGASIEPSGDCDDKNAMINPGASEICDGFDDCDASTSEDGTASYTYTNDSGTKVSGCSQIILHRDREFTSSLRFP